MSLEDFVEGFVAGLLCECGHIGGTVFGTPLVLDFMLAEALCIVNEVLPLIPDRVAALS